MFSLAICDDEKAFVKGLQEYLSSCYDDDILIRCFTECAELIRNVEEYDMFYDVILMDVGFPEGDGIDTIKRVQERFPNTKVIYITGMLESALRIFETKPSNFLIKPLDYKKVSDALDRIREEDDGDSIDNIIIRTSGRVNLALSRKDIIYVESEAHKVAVVTDSGRHYTYEKLDMIEQRLGKTFLRIHKSYLINLRHVTGYKKTSFIMSNGEEIPISRSCKERVQEEYTAYMRGLLWD